MTLKPFPLQQHSTPTPPPRPVALDSPGACPGGGPKGPGPPLEIKKLKRKKKKKKKKKKRSSEQILS